MVDTLTVNGKQSVLGIDSSGRPIDSAIEQAAGQNRAIGYVNQNNPGTEKHGLRKRVGVV